MVNVINNIKRNRTVIISIGVILVLNLIALYPVLVSGWYHDDYINSYIRGTMGIEGVNLQQFMKIRLGWWLSEGRFYPLSGLFSIIFFLFSYPVYLLKGVYILGTMFASISYFFLIRKLSNSLWFALLPIALLPIIFQYRSYHDPLTAYHLFMQATFIELTISMLLFLNYLMDSKKSHLLLGASILLYIIFLLTYEISILFILLYLIIALYFTESISRTLRTTWPFLFSVLIIFMITLYFRANATFKLETYTIELSVANGLKTWINQIVSTIPFSYAFFNDPGAFRQIRSLFNIADVIIVFGFIVAFSYVFKRIDRIDHQWPLFFTSILFIVLPGALLALSPKYQAEIKAGNGYIPVFFQYYGGVLLIALGITFLKQKLHSYRWWKILASVIVIALSMMFVINLKLNINSIEQFNTTWYYPRSVLEQSLQSGLFDTVPPNSLVLNQIRYIPYKTNSDFYYQFTGQKYSTQDFYDYMTNYFDENQLTDNDTFTLQIPNDVYLLDFHALNNSQGYVLLSKVKEISGTRSNYGVKIDRASLFLVNSNNWYNHLQNLLLENKPLPLRYRTTISIADTPLSSLEISNNVKWKTLHEKSKIEITGPRTGNSDVITIRRTDNQPFAITDIKLVRH